MRGEYTSSSTSDILKSYENDYNLSHWLKTAKEGRRNSRSPELTSLLLRCQALSQMPIVPFFVFDGPERPSKKRGINVRTMGYWFDSQFKEMLDIFGYRHIVVSAVDFHRISR